MGIAIAAGVVLCGCVFFILKLPVNYGVVSQDNNL